MPAAPAQAATADWQQKGITFYPYSSTDFSSDNFKSSVLHYKGLGMNTITLIIPVYQSNTGSIDIAPGYNTPTDASLADAATFVHAQGLQMMFSVHLETYTGEWRANINPSDRDGWYANYLTMLTHYGKLAAAQHVEAYCLGTEMIDVASPKIHADNTQRWQKMIAGVRQVFPGKVTYDANWGDDPNTGEAVYTEFWPSLDFIGISGYYPISGDGSLTQSSWAWTGWKNHELQPIYDKTQKPIVFTEIGYRSVTNARQQPFNSWMGGNYDPQEQANDYEALFQFGNTTPYLQGADFWYAATDPNAGGQNNTDYFTRNKPVEQVIQRYFQTNATTTPSAAPTFTVTGNANPTQTTAGQPVTLAATMTDTGGAAFGSNVDMEVYDAAGHQVAQKIFTSQNFAAGQAQSYSLAWTPSANGTYTFKAGIFDSNWNVYTWNNSVAQITVGSAPSTGTGGTGTTTGTTTPPPTSNTSATFTATGSYAPSTATAGQPVTVTAHVNDSGAAASNANVDLEVFDGAGHQTYQKLYPSESFAANQAKSYDGAWTPTGTGTYTFKIGVFDSNWHLYTWNDNAAQIVVGNASAGGTTGTTTGTTTPPGGGTVTPPTANPTLQIWWPTNGASVSGTQPFKAALSDTSLSAYSMYWQVDGDMLNLMSDSLTDAPHKEAVVDLSSWTWKGTGPYMLTFVAKDSSGKVLAQQSVSITVTH